MSDAATLVDLLVERARLHPARLAFRFLADGEHASDEISYAGLDRQARTIARLLLQRVAPGARALLQLPSDLSFIAAFFGCLYAGVIAVPAPLAHRRRPADALLGMIADCDPAAVLTTGAVWGETHADVVGAMSIGGRVPILVDLAAAGPALPEPHHSARVEPGSLAFLQYTSGSTSAPKGVMVSHANLLHNQRMIRDACGHTERTVVVGWLPMFHDMGLIGNVLQPLFLGVPCTLMPAAMVLQKPHRWLRAIDRYRATTSGGPNFAYDMCVGRITPEQMAGLDLSSWTVAFNGAEPVRADTLGRFTSTFAPAGFRATAWQPCYGLAEATLRVCGPNRPGAPSLLALDAAALERNQAMAAATPDGARNLVACGPAAAFHGVQVRIVDPRTCEAVPDGTVGEIWISGPNVACGYWRKPEATAATFHAVLATGSGSGAIDGAGVEPTAFLRTGDLGFLHAGELFVSGRLKDVLVIRGRNVYPHDIEHVMQASSPLLEDNRGAAFLVDLAGEERLVVAAEVCAAARRSVEPETVRAVVRESIARHFGLGVYQVVLLVPGSIPRTTSGKIRRGACREHFLNGTWPSAPLGDAGRACEPPVLACDPDRPAAVLAL